MAKQFCALRNTRHIGSKHAFGDHDDESVAEDA